MSDYPYAEFLMGCHANRSARKVAIHEIRKYADLMRFTAPTKAANIQAWKAKKVAQESEIRINFQCQDAEHESFMADTERWKRSIEGEAKRTIGQRFSDAWAEFWRDV